MKKLLVSIGLALLPVPMVSQQRPTSTTATTPARSGSRGTRLILLGTAGGPVLRVARSEPASLLVVDGRPYLIDCGEGTSRQIKIAGFEASDITRVFITHLHFDHVAGLSSIMGFDWVPGNRQPMEIYGPPGTSAVTHGALDYLSIPEQLYSAEFPPHPSMADIIHPHDEELTAKTMIYQDDKVKVFAIENSHYSTMHLGKQSYGYARSYSYRFETADRTIVFTGDTGPSSAVEELAHGADILVSEVIDLGAVKAYLQQTNHSTEEEMRPLFAHQEKEHLSPSEVGKLAAAAGVKMVVLNHLAPSDDVSLDTLRYTYDVRRFFNGPVVAGRDFDQF